MDNLTAYEQFQQERYGNILPDAAHIPAEEMFESGVEELNRLSEWTGKMAELELDR